MENNENKKIIAFIEGITKEIGKKKDVAPEEADFEKNKISFTSPIGSGLLGKKPGETVQIKEPAGMLEYKVIEIGR